MVVGWAGRSVECRVPSAECRGADVGAGADSTAAPWKARRDGCPIGVNSVWPRELPAPGLASAAGSPRVSLDEHGASLVSAPTLTKWLAYAGQQQATGRPLDVERPCDATARWRSLAPNGPLRRQRCGAACRRRSTPPLQAEQCRVARHSQDSVAWLAGSAAGVLRRSTKASTVRAAILQSRPM